MNLQTETKHTHTKTVKKVCVIGAGPSGLIAIKELLDEGHEVTCFEKHARLGGVFNYKDFEGGICDSTLLTVSNYFMAYSCYPPTDEKRKYWTFQEYIAYLCHFAEQFNLEKHISFNRKTVSVKQQHKGMYEVIVEDSQDPEKTEIHYFDKIAVCSGTHQIPRYVELNGQDKFKGHIYHSADFTTPETFKGKQVLCVGIGESGADVTHQISQVADECMLSIRQYQTVVERYPFGRKFPNDAFTSYALYSIPTVVQNWLADIQLAVMEKLSKDKKVIEYARWNRITGNLFNHFFTKNEVFFKSIVEGKLKVNTSGIDHLNEDCVVFNDGSQIKVDMVMLNTGYVDQFPFIKDAKVNNIRSMYKHMIHPELGSDIVFIGFARPGVGGVPACSEMQSRYFALLCSDTVQLPGKHQLEAITLKQAAFEESIYFKNPGVKSLVHYSTYMHDFAKLIGCSPWRLPTFLNPRLLYNVWFGSQLPNVYRLYGPHQNTDQAKKIIYKLPIAINPIEQLVYLLLTGLSGVLTRLGVIKSDLAY